MYALKVSINDEPPVVGGAADLGVLLASVACNGFLGSKSHLGRTKETPDFEFRLGGLTSRAPGNQNESLVWLQRRDIRVGDRVSIEIVQVDEANNTISETEVERSEAGEREYFEHMKNDYLRLRDKYEPEA